MYKGIIAVIVLLSAVVGCQQNNQNNTLKNVVSTSDSLATERTQKLYAVLKSTAKKGTMLGHQDDLAYGHDWYGVDGKSDFKDVTGGYPAVVGWEIGDVELGKSYNLDSVYFEDMRKFVRQTAERGGVSTFSWHANNIATGGNAWDCKQDTVVKSILPGGVHHEEYLRWLSKVGDFFLSLTDDEGELIPIVFRPYHEHTGSWFWWGADQCTPEEYKALWKMTIDYFQQEKQIHHILYCYSPSETRDEEHFLERYPSDDQVDLVAFDCYVPNQGTAEDLETYKQAMAHNIAIVTGYAKKSGKLATIGETGYEGIKNPDYFTETIYPLIQNKELAWVLFWRNAYEKDKREHYYIPYKGHPAAADLKILSEKDDILLGLLPHE